MNHARNNLGPIPLKLWTTIADIPRRVIGITPCDFFFFKMMVVCMTLLPMSFKTNILSIVEYFVLESLDNSFVNMYTYTT